MHATFSNQWSTGMGVNRLAQPFDDRATRGGPGAFRSATNSMWAYVNSDGRKPASFNVFGYVGKEREGSTYWEIGPTLDFRPTAFVSASAGVFFVHNDQRSQWVEDLDDQRVFGRIDQRTVSFTAPLDYAGNPDFNYRSFRTTNVVRWEYRPGSTLFVVWQQGREDQLDRGTFNFRSDVSSVFAAPARNVFLVKCSYWLNF